MKITAFRIEKFLGARAVDVTMKAPVCLIAGQNGAGKSSIGDAIRMAITGEPQRVKLKKDVKPMMITEGSKVGYSVVDFDGGKAAYTLNNGAHELAAPMPQAVPYVLDAQRFAAMTADDRRTFLFGLTGGADGIDGAEVRRMLTDRVPGVSADRLEKVVPLVRSGFPAAAEFAASEAKEAKSAWRAVTGETWGAAKGAAWAAPVPHVPEHAAGSLESAKKTVEELTAKRDAAMVNLGALSAQAAAAANASRRWADLSAQAGKLESLRQQHAAAEAEIVEFAAKVDDIRTKASGKAGLLHDMARAIAGLINEPQPLGIGRPEYLAASQVLETYIGTHGEVTPATADPEAALKLPEYERGLQVLTNRASNLRRDIAAAESAAEEAAKGAPESPDAINAKAKQASEEVASIGAQITEWTATIKALVAAMSAADDAADRTAKARELHDDIAAWIAIADALAPDGIPADILAKRLKPINDALRASATATGWAQPMIGVDMTITAEGRPYQLLSESEQWRVDAMIAEAVATLSGVRMITLDRVDVLDLQGRAQLIGWLDQRSADPDGIESAILFGTFKAPPAGLPASHQVVWIENGEARA